MTSFSVEAEERGPTGGTVRVRGMLEAKAVPEFEAALLPLAGDERVTDIVLDFSGLEFVASAGLRVFLKAVKEMAPRKAVLHGVGMRGEVLPVFRMTGLLRYIQLYAAMEDCPV